jgi:rsbT antagonist protein RsbS
MKGQIPVLRLGSNLLVSIQQELTDSVAESLQQDVLSAIEKTGSTGLLIDVTALDTVDTYVASVLTGTAQMARLMGTRSVVVGIRPEVAATLVHMGFRFEGIETALNAEEGLALLTE